LACPEGAKAETVEKPSDTAETKRYFFKLTNWSSP